jgi:hypothetical protein
MSERSVDVQRTTRCYIPEDILNSTENAKDTPYHVLRLMLYRSSFGCDLLYSKTDVPANLQAVNQET